MRHVVENLPYEDERRGPAGVFGATTARADVLLALAAAVAVAAVIAIIAEGGAASAPAALTAVLVSNIATFAVAGLLWRSSRPSSLIGTLLLLEGLLVAVSSLAVSSHPDAHLVGVLAGWAAAIGLTWLVLAFPRERPRGRAAWAVLSLALATLVFELVSLLISPTVPIGDAVGQCVGACPANPIGVADAPGAAQTLMNVESVLQALSAAGLVAYMVLQFMQANRPHRRTLTLLYAAMIPFAVALAVTSVLSGIAGVQVGDVGQAMVVATRIVAPLGFVGGLLYARSYVAEALAYMSTRLVGEPSLASVEHLVRTVLDDPRARLAFWLPRRQDFVDRHGKEIKSDPSDEGVSWWSLRHGGEPNLAIVHDSVLDDEPELLEAVGVATTLALENRRLHHDLVDTVQALHASQKRLVSAASEERRRLERDLHDGAQQKLVALRIRVGLARSSEAGADELGDFGSDLDEAIQDLRSLAHGIFPPLLADEGLGPALREAALRSAVPVEVRIDDPGRLTPECETAVYYCCLEALQNVAKHAGDDAAARLRLWDDQRFVRFSVVDDGTGFVGDRGTGTVGLTNMEDRIGAVGGSLTVRSSPGAGTRVEGLGASGVCPSRAERPRRGERAMRKEGSAYRVVVAEDSYLIREGIRRALEQQADEIEVLEYCADLPTLLEAVERHRPDVVLTDIRMPPTHTNEGIQAAAALRTHDPEIGVVVISQYVTPHYALALFEGGSAGRAYILKEHIGHRIQLMGVIREVASGGSVVDPQVVDVLVEARARAKNSKLGQLTPREREVLAGVAAGKSNSAIAEALFMTRRAVEKNINSIFSKLGLRDETEVSRRVRAALLFLAEQDLEDGSPEV